MIWLKLTEVLEEATEFLTYAAKSRLPGDYAIRENIKFVLNIDNDSFTIDFHAPDYWKYVDGGRRPGKFPPVNSLISWIRNSLTRKRNITPRALPSSKTSVPPTNGVPTIDQLAFLIGRKISKEGIKGNGFYELTVEEFKKEFTDKIEDAITEDISNQLDEFLASLGDQSNQK